MIAALQELAGTTWDRLQTQARISRGALVVIAAPSLFAVLASLLLPGAGAGPTLLVVLASLVPLARPARFGCVPALVVLAAFWIAGYGRAADVSAPRAVAFAVLVYLVFDAAALAAGVPAGAYLAPEVVLRWARGSIVGVAAAVVTGLVVSVIGTTNGSPGLDVVGLFAAVAAAGGLAYLAAGRRTS